MTSILNGLGGFRTQVAIWGYAVQGDTQEFAAIISETRTLDEHLRAWDRRMEYLYGIDIYIDAEPKTTPYWYALPWVAEQRLPESVQRVGHEQRRWKDDGPVFAEALRGDSAT